MLSYKVHTQEVMMDNRNVVSQQTVIQPQTVRAELVPEPSLGRLVIEAIFIGVVLSVSGMLGVALDVTPMPGDGALFAGLAGILIPRFHKLLKAIALRLTGRES